MKPESLLQRWKGRARELRANARALYLAARDPRVPWYARACIFLVLAYAFSPIDLIPDFIPVIGFLDDLLLLPLGIALAVRLMPREIWLECQERASGEVQAERRHRWAGAGLVVLLWLLTVGFVVILLWPSQTG
ncbi:MAG: DUF1232 domain-containing protein [Gemmatimonadota bacterium]|nr:DUF1232 domain-containing protein [Gemmatimonadota bacterium]